MRTGAVFLALAAAGCGAAAPPDPDVARVQAAIEGAEDLGASAEGTAGLYLSLARHDLDEARRSRDVVEGRRWLARARVDVELAGLAAREVGVRGALERTLAEAKTLEDALERLSTGDP